MPAEYLSFDSYFRVLWGCFDVEKFLVAFWTSLNYVTE
jgi:hypothetical protein